MRDEAKIRQQLHEILDICLDCNGFERRSAGISGTLPTAFFDLSGHVATVAVRIITDGWRPGDYGKEFEFRFDAENREESIDTLRAYAQHALTEKKGIRSH